MPRCSIAQPGCWQNMGRLHIDHHQVIGHGIKKSDNQFLKDLFGNHCQILKDID